VHDHADADLLPSAVLDDALISALRKLWMVIVLADLTLALAARPFLDGPGLRKGTDQGRGQETGG
jgi:hypothetical protein